MTKEKEKTKQSSKQNQLFEQSPYYKGLIGRSLRYLETGYPVHFTGPSGIGKTTLALHIAKKRKRPMRLIHGNKGLSNQDLIGAFTGYKRHKLKDNYVRTVYKVEENITESWTNGRLLEAVTNGYTLIYDEFTRSKPDTNNIFLPILEERIFPLYGTKQKQSHVKVHPEFNVIFTSNPMEYAGVYTSQDALLDRMVTVNLEAMDRQSEVLAVTDQTGIKKEHAEAIVNTVEKIRGLGASRKNGHGPGLRASIMIADIAKRYNIPIDGTSQEFAALCLDVTWFPLQASLDKADDRMRSKVESIVEKV